MFLYFYIMNDLYKNKLDTIQYIHYIMLFIDKHGKYSEILRNNYKDDPSYYLAILKVKGFTT
jgi:hypothetical protein